MRRPPRSKTARKRAVTRAVKEVAHYLGNTPAVCRASYIDPRVFDRFDAGLTIGGVLEEIGDTSDMGSLHGKVEEAVLDLIARRRGLAGHREGGVAACIASLVWVAGGSCARSW